MKKKLKTCYTLIISWYLDDEGGYSVYLFSSLKKAQEKLTEAVKCDFKNCISMFSKSLYVDLNNNKTIENYIPFNILSGVGILNTKYITFYNELSSDHITYCIAKKEIK